MKTLFALVCSMGLASAAWAEGGNVYVMSNGISGNQVAVLSRAGGGALTVSGTYSTGGNGSGVGTADPFDPLGSQNALLLSEDHHWLFAVDAGSNQISVLRILGDRLALADVVPSGGNYPVSLAQRGNRIYVLNSNDGGNVTGFWFDGFGKLHPIPGSTRLLHAQTPDVGAQPDSLRSPTQLQFTPDGAWLVVPIKNLDALGTIQLFAVGEDGALAEAPVITNSFDPLPFGFMFDRKGHLLITEGLAGAVTSYRVEDDGTLAAIDRTVKNGQIATCWIDGTSQFVYASNTNSNTLSGYRLDRDGSLQLLNANGIAFDLGANHDPVDVRVSGDRRFLDVANTGNGSVSTFRIDPVDGKLLPVGETAVFPALSGMEGLAAE